MGNLKEKACNKWHVQKKKIVLGLQQWFQAKKYATSRMIILNAMEENKDFADTKQDKSNPYSGLQE